MFVKNMIENNISEPKNILLNVTTQLLVLLSIVFFEIVFSIAQSIVAARMSRSPVLI